MESNLAIDYRAIERKQSIFSVLGKIDPSHTLPIKKKFIDEIEKRFNWLIELIEKGIGEQDLLGLNSEGLVAGEMISVDKALEKLAENRYAFKTSAQKIDGFMEWLDDMEDAGVLETKLMPGVGRIGAEVPWTDTYIQSAYQQGIYDSRQAMKSRGVDITLRDSDPTKDMITSFNTPFHAERVGILYTRTFNDLKGIGRAMDAQISRVLAQGISEGKNSREVARMLVDRVNKIGITRAKALARTEIQRAHHHANINEYEAAGLNGVVVKAEWETGANPCEICAALQGEVFTLQEIRGMIPVHPNCFLKGTPVYTSRGWKEIEKVELGDMVLTHRGRYRKVVQLHRNKTGFLTWMRELNWDSYFSTPLVTTLDHLIFLGLGQWVPSRKALVNDVAWTIPEIYKGVFSPIRMKMARNKLMFGRTGLYNLSVEEDESYIAQGLVVHNCACVALPYQPGIDKVKPAVPSVSGWLPDCEVVHDIMPFGLEKGFKFVTLMAKKCLTGVDKSKVKRAIKSHIPATRLVQRQAIKNQGRLARNIKGAREIGDNDPFDVMVGSASNPKHLIEVKTIVRGKNSKITMHTDALGRKKAFAAKYPDAKVHTVVFDDRVGKVYYNEGVGSFRLKGMTEVKSVKDVGKLVETGRIPKKKGMLKITGDKTNAAFETDNFVGETYAFLGDEVTTITRKSDNTLLRLSTRGDDALKDVKVHAKELDYYFRDKGKPLLLDPSKVEVMKETGWLKPSEPTAFKIDKFEIGLKDIPKEIQKEIGWTKGYVKNWGFRAYFPKYSTKMGEIIETGETVGVNAKFTFPSKKLANEFRDKWKGYITG